MKDIKQLRKSSGKVAENYTDEELVKIEGTMTILADIMIDRYLSMSKEERKKFTEKIKAENKQKENVIS